MCSSVDNGSNNPTLWHGRAERIQTAIGKLRVSQTKRERLSLDLLAVASSLRPCVMLDYVRIQAQALQQLVDQLILSTVDWAGCVLCFEDCLYVCDLRRMAHIWSTISADPKCTSFVRFCSGSALMLTDWSGSNHEEVLLRQVRFGSDLFSAALKRHQARGDSLTPCTVVDLAEHSQSLPLLPTLNGILLWYPIVYWVHNTPQAEAACRTLSSTNLVLVSVTCSSRFHSSVSALADTRLLAFSVPSHLWTAVMHSQVNKWFKDLTSDCIGLWDCRLHVDTVGPRAIVL